MVLEKAFFIFFSTYCLFGQSNGQGCVSSVASVTIAANSTLFWEPGPENCVITSFTVDVVGDQEDEYHFTVSDHSVDLSFLPICERWRFTVTPFSFDVVGFPHTITSYVPLPPSADLTLNYFGIYNYSDRTISLEWELRNKTHGDCSLKYLLTLEDHDRGVLEDYYLEGESAKIPDVSPCIYYGLTLRAVNQAHPTIEGPQWRFFMRLYALVQFTPTLQSIDIQPTSVDMTWNLEGDTNRCPLSSFHIDGGAYFNQTVSLQNSPDQTTVSVHIDALLPDRMYQMTAYVENSAGRSRGAPIAVQTLELSPN